MWSSKYACLGVCAHLHWPFYGPAFNPGVIYGLPITQRRLEKYKVSKFQIRNLKNFLYLLARTKSFLPWMPHYPNQKFPLLNASLSRPKFPLLECLIIYIKNFPSQNASLSKKNFNASLPKLKRSLLECLICLYDKFSFLSWLICVYHKFPSQNAPLFKLKISLLECLIIQTEIFSPRMPHCQNGKNPSWHASFVFILFFPPRLAHLSVPKIYILDCLMAY